jgi:hypothetical protein
VEDRRAGEGQPGRGGSGDLLVLAVTAGLFLAASGYLVASMLGLVTGPDWTLYVAGGVMAGAIGVARLYTA